MEYRSILQGQSKGVLHTMFEWQAEDVFVLMVQCHRQRIILEVGRAGHVSSVPLQKEGYMGNATRLDGPGPRCFAGAIHLPFVGSISKENLHGPGR